MCDQSRNLAEADDCHDADPARAAALLAGIDAAGLEAGERPLFAFLLNHVLGEKLGDWAQALRRQSALLAAAGEAAPPVLWRQSAVAATLAGELDDAHKAVAGLARAADVGEPQAQELLQLAAAGCQVPGRDAEAAAALAMHALLALDAPHWHKASALDTPAAAACNNLASQLSERSVEELRSAALREATLRAALCSQRLWQRAGDWVNQERACYGVAVATGAAGDAAAQLEAASDGLALLDRHDAAAEQTVDRAFLDLERAHALQRLGRHGEADAARANADALAAAFEDASLTNWYRSRVERHRQLLAQ
jgi:hypothetical protein